MSVSIGWVSLSCQTQGSHDWVAVEGLALRKHMPKTRLFGTNGNSE